MKNKRIIFFIICLIGVIFIIYHYFGYGRYIFLGSNAPMPNELNPIVRSKVEQLIEQSKNKGFTIEITESIRSVERQNELYEQGRSREGDIVTYAKGGESYHNYGLAIDFVLIDANKQKTWDYQYDGNGNGRSDWEEVANIAKELGFEWGGDWSSFQDYPHLQMTFGLSIQQLQRGFRPKQEGETELFK